MEKIEQLGELRPISEKYLYVGMRLAEDVYNYNGKLRLLVKGDVLDEFKISKLRKFNSGSQNISVFAKTYEELISRGIVPDAYSQQLLEKNVGYTETKEKTGKLFEETRKTHLVSRKQADDLSHDLMGKLITTDPAIILQCINAPKPMDEYLRRHSMNVSLINGMMGRWLKLPQEDIDNLVLSGLLHDIGKTKMPNEILEAPRRLTVTEFEVIKMHPIYSLELLESEGQFDNQIRLVARHHHEKSNGSGYPDGIKADKISLFAKITAISDVYDAMVSKRSYKDASSPFLVLSQLNNNQFSELDVGLVSLFIQNMPTELLGKPVLMSDGSVGTIKFIIPYDLGHPLVEVNGITIKTTDDYYCSRMIVDDQE